VIRRPSNVGLVTSRVTPWLLWVAAASTSGCLAGGPGDAGDPEPAYHQLQGEAFGTTWHLTWAGPEPERVEPRVTSVLRRVDERMSSWRPDSELSAIRQGPGVVVVSEETAEVVQAALRLADASQGAFDPTVEPLMELWGFRGERRQAPPTDARIAEVMNEVGFWKVEAFRHGGLPLVDAHGAALDLSAIAKGHAVDAVHHALAMEGVTDMLVEIGGEVRVAGRGPSGPWTLAVEAPVPGAAPGAAQTGVLRVSNVGLATSGNYRSAYELGGQTVVHTMDPRTGRPSAGEVKAVTVVAPTCREADGWATALMVLSVAEGQAAVARRPELEALWVVGEGDEPSTVASDGMPDVTAAAVEGL